MDTCRIGLLRPLTGKSEAFYSGRANDRPPACTDCTIRSSPVQETWEPPTSTSLSGPKTPFPAPPTRQRQASFGRTAVQKRQTDCGRLHPVNHAELSMLLLCQPYVRLRTIVLATVFGDLFVAHRQPLVTLRLAGLQKKGRGYASILAPFPLDQLRSVPIAYFPFAFFTTVIVRDEGYSFE